MPKIWDSYSFRVSGFYLSAMFNGDYSSLNSADISEYQAFEGYAFIKARADGFTVRHWSTDTDIFDDWGLCDISGLLAMRGTVNLLVYKAL